MAHSKNHILVVGGGFGGVKVALQLSKNEDVHVTLLSDRLDFRYYPALYHTATGGLKAQSSIPLPAILDESKVHVVQGTAKTLDRENKKVITEDGQELAYGTLVLALGAVTNFFGIEGLEQFSYSIKSTEAIQKFKDHLHQQLAADHKPDLNYVIVGAGPTGIELAGALPHYLRTVMKNHGIKHRAVHIDIIEAAPRLLPRSNKAISRAVRRRLRSLGIQLYLGEQVQGETADALMVSGRPLQSHTVVWSAGVANNPFFKNNNFALNERGKVTVNAHLEAEPGIFVIGDNADTQYSGLAQTALSDAVYVSNTIEKQLAGKNVKPYKPKMPISVIPVGHGWATVEWGKIHFAGRFGWILRELADLVAFHDYEPWWKASEQWLTEFGSQEDCPTCATAEN